MEFSSVKIIALAVTDFERAKSFYGNTLGLVPDTEHGMEGAFVLGDTILLLKPTGEWYGRPTDSLNARLTLEVKDARATEQALRAQGVTISDPVAVYDGYPVGAFLDSEGNKLWFCSD